MFSHWLLFLTLTIVFGGGAVALSLASIADSRPKKLACWLVRIFAVLFCISGLLFLIASYVKFCY